MLSSRDPVARCYCNTGHMVLILRSALLWLCVAYHSALRSHMSVHSSDCSAQEREHSGTWTSHLFTISSTRAWLMKGLTPDWLWLIHHNMMTWRGACLFFGGWGSTVWNLEETRDCCWSSALKGTKKAGDRALATMTFLSNDLNGRFCLSCSLFTWSSNSFIFLLHNVYLWERACVSMCTVYFYQCEKKPGPPTQDSTEIKVKAENKVNKLQLIISKIKHISEWLYKTLFMQN